MRLKSNARWMDLPGVECAYQSVGSPTAVDTLLNVAHDHRSVGKYTATPGVLPAWTPERGHTYNLGNQWLKVGVTPTNDQSWSMLIRFSNSSTGFSYICGCAASDFSNRLAISPNNSGTMVSFWNGDSPLNKTPGLTSGVLGIAGNTAYRNGSSESGTLPTGSGTRNDVAIGGYKTTDINGLWTGNVLSFLIASRIFTAAEMWLASRQMAYCEVNPDWNAWSRRRQYFYAPSAAAIRWPGVGRGGPVGGSPGIRGSQ